MYWAALRSIFSELIRQERLVVLQELNLDSPKTKNFLKQLNQHGLVNALIVAEEIAENLYLAARNLPKIDVIDVHGINPVNLIGFEKVVFTLNAIKKVEEILS
jgi:large subunit ribosomal protein L4